VIDADDALEAQRRYARWLAWGTRVGLAMLVAAFLAYAFGLVPAHVPVERVATLWNVPASEYLRIAGVEPGWGWARLIHRGDMIAVAAIAFLASCSVACLAAVIPVFHRRKELAFVGICVLEIAVLALAASGLFASH
jgi:hypothetical protein